MTWHCRTVPLLGNRGVRRTASIIQGLFRLAVGCGPFIYIHAYIRTYIDGRTDVYVRMYMYVCMLGPGSWGQ